MTEILVQVEKSRSVVKIRYINSVKCSDYIKRSSNIIA